ncbi:MAG: hypothetical protein C0623_08340 [Desulfuromonas sp.]|nr:MAG: hypothetical protein C0623_08340 [Desulfuromonas sp.]
MLKTRTLNNIFYAALLLSVSLLLYVYFVIHPDYRELLIENAEDEAIRYVSFLVRSHDLKNQPIEVGTIPASIGQDVGRFKQDEALIKLRVFDPGGKIVYSTLPKEIGNINKNDYFHNQVAAGKVYSKTVQKDSFTAEMEIVKFDLVETYVPIMLGSEFHGAVETYYDVSHSSQAIEDLTNHSIVMLGLVSFLLLSLLYYALRHADQSIVARVRAEQELRQNNEELEERIAERTGELMRLNENLNDEVAEKTLAQSALSEALIDMEAAKDKVDGIVRSVKDGILVVDQTESVVLMNHQAELLVGVSHSQAVGKSIHEIGMSESLRDVLSEALSSSGSKNIDFEIARPAPERPRILQARSSVFSDRGGQVLGSVVLLQDVTVERQIDYMKRDFLAMAAHELMTPLASIMGYSELLVSETAAQLKEEQRTEFLDYIYRKAESLSRIVDDLLDVSRIEAGYEISISRVEFDLSMVLERLVDVYRQSSIKHEFILESECRNCTLYADPVRIEQVLENLLSNAVKYSPAGGDIRVECKKEAGSCRFAIADQGLGMTAEQIEHIFDKFYRVDQTDTARQGLGLGMSITKHIIDLHGGDIEVSSRFGEGTTVAVHLPNKGAQSIN